MFLYKGKLGDDTKEEYFEGTDLNLALIQTASVIKSCNLAIEESEGPDPETVIHELYVVSSAGVELLANQDTLAGIVAIMQSCDEKVEKELNIITKQHEEKNENTTKA